MQVILRQDVEKVGLRGEVVEVASGFARNFLLPRKLAEPVSPGRIAEIEKVEANRARHQAQTFEQAQELAQSLEADELRIDVQAGPTGTLFGSVTATDLADRLWEAKRVRVERRKIGLADSIKRIGRYELPVELFTDVTATLRVAVAVAGQELPPQEELEAEQAAEETALAATATQEAEVAGAEKLEPSFAEMPEGLPAENAEPSAGTLGEAPAEQAPEASQPPPG